MWTLVRGKKCKGSIIRQDFKKTSKQSHRKPRDCLKGHLLETQEKEVCQRLKIPGAQNQQSQREGYKEKNAFQKLE